MEDKVLSVTLVSEILVFYDGVKDIIMATKIEPFDGGDFAEHLER